MRAINPSRAPRRRGLITGLVTASVLTLSLFAGGTALGANPNWVVGHGTDSAAPPATQPAPPTAQPAPWHHATAEEEHLEAERRGLEFLGTAVARPRRISRRRAKRVQRQNVRSR